MLRAHKLFLYAFLALSVASTTASAQGNTIKIGIVSTFTRPFATIGNDMRDAFVLGLEQRQNKLQGADVELLLADDDLKPERAFEKTQTLIDHDKVDFLVGYYWPLAMAASLRPIVNSKTFTVVTSGGAAKRAVGCSESIFSVAPIDEQMTNALGAYMRQRNISKTFVVGADPFDSGALSAFSSGFKSTDNRQAIIEKQTTPQRFFDGVDFSSEFGEARRARSQAIFAFYPYNGLEQFILQFAKTDLRRDVALYTTSTMDENLLRLGESAVGIRSAQSWSNDLPNQLNQRFVSDFRKKYGRMPSIYAAQTYDAVGFLERVVQSVRGDLSNKDRLRQAATSLRFDSVRGNFVLGTNRIPIQDIYLQEYTNDKYQYPLRTVATIAQNAQYNQQIQCVMPSGGGGPIASSNFQPPPPPPENSFVTVSSVNKQEVDTGEARGSIHGRLETRKQDTQISQQDRAQIDELQRELSAEGEIARAGSCGRVVASELRKKFFSIPPNNTPFPSGADRIELFDQLCLLRTDQPFTQISATFQKATKDCKDAYLQYVKYCFQSSVPNALKAVLDSLEGVIVAQNSGRRPIICSGLRVGPNTVLTALHCLDDVELQNESPPTVWFYSFQNPKLAIPLTVALTAPDFKQQTLFQATRNVKAIIQVRGNIEFERDVLLLKSEGATWPNSMPQVEFQAPRQSGQRIVLGGFQKLKLNEMLLDARVKDENLSVYSNLSLLQSGNWINAFLYDANPTCILEPYVGSNAPGDPVRVFGHSCQSFQTGSGSAAIAYSDSAVPKIVAVHIQSLTTAIDEVIEKTRPKNLAVIMNDSFIAAIKNSQ